MPAVLVIPSRKASSSSWSPTAPVGRVHAGFRHMQVKHHMHFQDHMQFWDHMQLKDHLQVLKFTCHSSPVLPGKVLLTARDYRQQGNKFGLLHTWVPVPWWHARPRATVNSPSRSNSDPFLRLHWVQLPMLVPPQSTPHNQHCL